MKQISSCQTDRVPSFKSLFYRGHTPERNSTCRWRSSYLSPFPPRGITCCRQLLTSSDAYLWRCSLVSRLIQRKWMKREAYRDRVPFGIGSLSYQPPHTHARGPLDPGKKMDFFELRVTIVREFHFGAYRYGKHGDGKT
ncbi:hypothetical protein CDAR_114661 [Caerostris darwini]|uniref:Uncharacterized protein n=1 Tax=Caerostris darwini TaxID=1538125 RepID=A0AAV4MFL4_9ARAC|nr:hypothetical protein CDAR_114661 [Caerostris darwini]